jgi:hypothetical protein
MAPVLDICGVEHGKNHSLSMATGFEFAPWFGRMEPLAKVPGLVFAGVGKISVVSYPIGSTCEMVGVPVWTFPAPRLATLTCTQDVPSISAPTLASLGNACLATDCTPPVIWDAEQNLPAFGPL